MRKTLITGLAILIPLLVTIYMIVLGINVAAAPFLVLSKKIFHQEFLNHFLWIKDHLMIQIIISKILAVIFLFISSVALGLIARTAFKKYFIDKPLNILKKIPVLGFVITFSSSLSQKLLDPKNKKFLKKTVLLPFFGSDKFVLGILTSEKTPPFLSKNSNINSVVLVPSSPHPVSGFLILTESQALKLTSLDPNEALAYIASCGSQKI